MTRKREGNRACGRVLCRAANAFSAGIKCQHCSANSVRKVSCTEKSWHENSMKEYFIFMYENEISMHEKEISPCMKRIFSCMRIAILPKIFHG